jgi:hypothetical protein
MTASKSSARSMTHPPASQNCVGVLLTEHEGRVREGLV